MRGNDLLPDEEGERKYYHVSPGQTRRNETALGRTARGNPKNSLLTAFSMK